MNPRFRTSLFTILTCSLIIVFGGCSKKIKTSDTIRNTVTPENQIALHSEADERVEEEKFSELDISADDESRKTHHPLASHMILDLEDIFFDYDKDHIRPEALRILQKNAEWLKKNSQVMILIEGHADERGTNVYNLALGEKRARAAKRYLASLGISSDRIKVLSYGEERPFCHDRHEDCWQQNRRGHFVSTN